VQHVIAGLDPAIRHEVMDARVKPAHDADIGGRETLPLLKLDRAAEVATAIRRLDEGVYIPK
jgi:hypothetical protein